MSTDNDVARSLGSWLKENRHEDADRVLDAVFHQLPATPQRQPLWRTWRPSLMNNMVRVAIVAAAAVMIAVFGFSVLRPGGSHGGPPPSGHPTPTAQPTLRPAPSGPVDIRGLPPAGAAISDPTPGELVLRFVGSGGSVPRSSTIWVYADGRLIWNRMYYFPADAGDAYIGLAEQRLTPSGIEFLRSKVLATGLFEADLEMGRDTPGFLNIQLRNGDRLVAVNWATYTNLGLPQTAPPATFAQATLLNGLSTLFNNPASWPDTAWADRAERAYVPGRLAIRLRHLPDPIEPAQALPLLPQVAQDLYRAGDPVPGASVLTIEDARALAEILERSTFQRLDPGSRATSWLRYVLRNQPTSGDQLWISFEPILPDGEAVWLGPG